MIVPFGNAQTKTNNQAEASAPPQDGIYEWYIDKDRDGYGVSNEEPIMSLKRPKPNYVTNNNDYDDTTKNITNIPPQYFYQDNDNDTFGNPGVSLYYSIKPVGYVANNADCNDVDATLNPNTAWYRDADSDSYGTSAITKLQCTQPAGYLRNASDCNDGDASLNPNTVWYRDADGDGYGTSTPTATGCTQPAGYVRNASDYNDTTANITNIAPQTFYQDADGDTFGNPNVSIYYSVKPAGYVANNSDYNDTTVNITNIAPQTFYRDADGDTFGNPSVTLYYSVKPTGYVNNSSDYNDTTVNITNIAPQYFYQDTDGDAFGNPSVSLYYSAKPTGYVNNNTDCDDGKAAVNPNTRWYADMDGDGFGDPSSFVQQCGNPDGNYVLNNTDLCPNIRGTGNDCESIKAPSLDQNYIIGANYKKARTTVYVNASPLEAQVNITYFDGLGRPMQQIANQQSDSGKDIITHIGYDDFGRQTKDYLPFASTATNMVYDVNAADNTVNFYRTDKYDNTSNPFSEKKLESSPLNRVLKQAAPGTDWAMNAGHEIKLDYQTNTGTEVKLYKATTTWNAGSGLYDISFSDAGNYEANQLYKTITYDENSAASPTESSGSTVEFKSKEGQVILKRTYESKTKHDTYYVYDSYGNLTYVLPPMFTNAAGQLDGLCYQYKYDNRNRLAEKKLPGKQWEFIVYDKLDRPVATGPAFSPFKDDTAVGWLITKYDAFSRPIYTGWYNYVSNSYTRKSLQDTQNSAAVLFETKQTSGAIDGIAAFYTNDVEPKSIKLLTVNYYDNYVFPNVPAIPSTIEGQNVLANTKTLATGSWTRVVTTASATLGETAAIFYDAKARPIRSEVTNYLGGYTNTDSKLDAFSGQLQYTISKHKRTTGDAELVVKEVFTYSPQDRLLTHTHQINGGTIQLLAANIYDELGQLTSKKVGGSNSFPLQKVDYTYNIRGWLTGINNDPTNKLVLNTTEKDLFGFKINYNTVENQMGYTGTPLYNGNISETYWRTASDNVQRKYGYKYDNLNRLSESIYQKPGNANPVPKSYDENLTYDKNGNILSLLRNGDIDGALPANVIDNLAYTYPANSNQLSKVADVSNNTSGFNDFNNTGDDYTYDLNGNLITDKNKNITEIVYNHLNLPVKITFGTTGSFSFIYDAKGQKVQKTVTVKTPASTTVTDYLGDFQYKNSVLQFFSTAEGYAEPNGSSFRYVWQFKDHIGNVRLSYSDANNDGVIADSEIIEESHFYGFGMKHVGYNSVITSTNPAQKYKYNGKELQDELGINWYDYGARNYDPALGRWMNIDPLAETSRRWSPYNYCMNNPVFFIDPDGKEVINGYQKSRDEALNKKNSKQSEFNSKYSGRDMKRGDFESNKEFKQYKSDKSGLESAESKFNDVDAKYQETQNTIDEYKSVDPEGFAKVNNLENGFTGTKIDVVVKFGYVSPNSGGASTTGNVNMQTNEFTGSGNINITYDGSIKSSRGTRIAHEFGHAFGMAQNPRESIISFNTAMYDYKYNNGPQPSCQNPENRNTLFAKSAMDFQERFILLQKTMKP
ncbi:RHS repeat-associated core domain-containing protein [Flavobacterium sp. ZT3R18]|nr:RHS repeat-associated core domain-containing protein [Flavobacterium sp. ZT3R18]